MLTLYFSSPLKPPILLIMHFLATFYLAFVVITATTATPRPSLPEGRDHLQPPLPGPHKPQATVYGPVAGSAGQKVKPGAIKITGDERMKIIGNGRIKTNRATIEEGGKAVTKKLQASNDKGKASNDKGKPVILAECPPLQTPDSKHRAAVVVSPPNNPACKGRH